LNQIGGVLKVKGALVLQVLEPKGSIC